MLTNNYYGLFTLMTIEKPQQSDVITTKMYRSYEGEQPNSLTINPRGAMYGLNSLLTISVSIDGIVTRAGIPNDISSESELISTGYYKFAPNGAQTDMLTATHSTGYVRHGSTYMILGSGSTKPKKTDYKLENFIGSDKLQCIACSQVTWNTELSEDEEFVLRKTWTFKNVSNEPVTVNETGLLVATPLNISASEAEANPKKYLVSREVLDSPVTIAPNQTYMFTFNLNC